MLITLPVANNTSPYNFPRIPIQLALLFVAKCTVFACLLEYCQAFDIHSHELCSWCGDNTVEEEFDSSRSAVDMPQSSV